ncbi:hypothetical protein [Flavobacterium crassostreae]|nr:hypothetical protein [Flavobacterium crassostreae]
MQESSRLEKAIRTGGYGNELDKDPYLNWSNEKIKEFASKVFPELFKDANSPDFEKQLMIGNDPNIAGRACKEFTVDASGKYTVRSLGKILIRSNVLNSIRQLATTVGHELNHVVDHISGDYANWANHNSAGVAHSLSETKATNWEIYMRQ